jgi:hypothetical protein
VADYVVFVSVAVVMRRARRKPYQFDQDKQPNWASSRRL